MHTIHTAHQRHTRIVLAIGALFPLAALALPTAPTVVNGSASFVQSGNVLTVTNSNQAIINWQTFSIGNNETTRFVQSSANSSVLNRVTTNDPSQILGSLQSNGRVYLINPAGILVGQGAKIDVAGFVASTLHLSDSDYLAGRFRFTETPGAGTVVNKGEIKSVSGGSIYLVAPQVENQGVISTPNGEVLLAAGQKVELFDTATPGIRIEIVGSAERATNLGTIVAEAGRIGIAGVLVENTGSLNASSLVAEGGRIFLKAQGETRVSGNTLITANGTTGGRVEILGQQVSLHDKTSIEALGQNGGGTVLVGGDYQGKNSAIQNAIFTDTSQQVTIKADALNEGDGGKIILWADDTTTARGTFSARGGVNGGNGGLIEVSGKSNLSYLASADTRAPLGKTGTLLLDPDAINMMPGAGTDNISVIATLYSDNITSNLASSNVILQTGSSGTGNITFIAGTYDFSAAGTTNSLSLWANSTGSGTNTGEINLPTGALITMAPGASIKMIAGWNGSTTSPGTIPYAAGYGNLTMTGSASITATGGEIKLQAAGDLAATNLTTNTLYGQAGNTITMNSSNVANNVNLQSAGAISYHTGNTGTTHVSASTTNNAISIIGDAGSGKIALGSLNAGTGNVTVNAQKNILDDNGTGVANIVSGGASLISQTGAPTSSEIAISANINGTGSLAASASGTYGGIRARWLNSASAPSSLSLTDATSTAGQGHIDYYTAGNINTGGATFSSTNGGVSIDTAGNMSYGTPTLTLGTGQLYKLSASGNMNFVNGINISNPISLNAGGTLTTTSGAITSTANTVSINASALNVSGGSIWGQTGLNVNAGSTSIAVSLGTSSGDLNLHTGALTLTNGGIEATAGAINIDASNVSMSNSSMMTAGTNLSAKVSEDMRINSASSLTAGGKVHLDLLGGNSVLYVNENTGMSASSINASNLIEIFFAGRSFGGVVIDGVETTTTGTSGFFVPSMTPAVPGSNLNITYGSLDNLITSQLIGSLSSTSSSSGLGLSDGGNTVANTSSSASGDGTDSFGNNESTTSTGGKPNDKNVKKKPPMCTP